MRGKVKMTDIIIETVKECDADAARNVIQEILKEKSTVPINPHVGWQLDDYDKTFNWCVNYVASGYDKQIAIEEDERPGVLNLNNKVYHTLKDDDGIGDLHSKFTFFNQYNTPKNDHGKRMQNLYNKLANKMGIIIYFKNDSYGSPDVIVGEV